MQLVKNRDGLWSPAYPKDWEESNRFKIGDEVKATKDRNPKFHRKFFALLNLGFSNQDSIAEFEIYRYIKTMQAGWVQFVTGKDRKEYPLPKSISFEKMSEDEFEKLFKAVLAVISKEIGTNGDMIEAELASFY